MNKVNTLFIFGAGASVPAGVPDMNSFLEKSKYILRVYGGRKEMKKYVDDFENIFSTISNLRGIHSKSYLDLDNLEILFGAIEFGLMINVFEEKNQTYEIKNSLIKLIVKTIEYSMFLINESGDYGPRLRPPAGYGGFLEVINKYQNKCNYSFLTFNYDVALEVAFQYNGIQYNYCLDENKKVGIPLLKLHGSLNWYKDKDDKKIKFLDFSPFSYYTLEHQENKLVLGIGSYIIESGNIPFIVPPTSNKSMYHEQLKNVWENAAKELSKAEIIFIIGYSLPETDLFFRYLYSLGTEGDTLISKIIIINPDPTLKEKYRNFIGRGLLERHFEYPGEYFENSFKRINIILSNL